MLRTMTVRHGPGALALLLVLLFWARPAEAHESRDVGPNRFIVGFASEPAYEGEPNGVDLRVSRGEGEDAVPVEGLEETLEVEVTHVPSGVSEVMPLRPVFGEPGRYTNSWIPTAPGAYRFRFTGTIDDLTVDEVFESGPDTFGSVESAAELYFPEPIPSARELEGAVRGAQSAADEALGVALDAERNLMTMQLMAIGALVLAVVALGLAVFALLSARRD